MSSESETRVSEAVGDTSCIWGTPIERLPMMIGFAWLQPNKKLEPCIVSTGKRCPHEVWKIQASLCICNCASPPAPPHDSF